MTAVFGLPAAKVPAHSARVLSELNLLSFTATPPHTIVGSGRFHLPNCPIYC